MARSSDDSVRKFYSVLKCLSEVGKVKLNEVDKFRTEYALFVNEWVRANESAFLDFDNKNQRLDEFLMKHMAEKLVLLPVIKRLLLMPQKQAFN